MKDEVNQMILRINGNVLEKKKIFKITNKEKNFFIF